MKTNILATADAVPDRYLLAHLEMLAVRERESLVDVVAHLATLDRRPALYAARGFGSLSAIAPRLSGYPKTPRALGSTPPAPAGVSR